MVSGWQLTKYGRAQKKKRGPGLELEGHAGPGVSGRGGRVPSRVGYKVSTVPVAEVVLVRDDARVRCGRGRGCWCGWAEGCCAAPAQVLCRYRAVGAGDCAADGVQ